MQDLPPGQGPWACAAGAASPKPPNTNMVVANAASAALINPGLFSAPARLVLGRRTDRGVRVMLAPSRRWLRIASGHPPALIPIPISGHWREARLDGGVESMDAQPRRNFRPTGDPAAAGGLLHRHRPAPIRRPRRGVHAGRVHRLPGAGG